jgi:curved DNA-binding protein CbpA
MPQIYWREVDATNGKTEPRPPRRMDTSANTSLYEVLEISSNASPEVIKAAYRVLMEKYHPDKHPEHRRGWAEEISRQLNAAYAVLGNSKRRDEYDIANGIIRGA